MTYSEKLKDPRWQKKRLELLEKSGWKCASEYCQNSNPNAQLHVHHQFYARKTEPWDYPDFCYLVLCEGCHERHQVAMERAHEFLALNIDTMFALSNYKENQSGYRNIGEIAARLCLRANRPKVLDAILEAIHSLVDASAASFSAARQEVMAQSESHTHTQSHTQASGNVRDIIGQPTK